MEKPRNCHICGTYCLGWCPTCLENFETRRNAEEMTGDERAEELTLLRGPAEIPFKLTLQRIVELVGHHVFIPHDIVGKEFDYLIEEARTR